MASLSFTLLPEAILQLHDVLICLAKFNESISIEAERDFLRFSALNSTKSAYAAFKFDAVSFFSRYSLDISLNAVGVAAKNIPGRLSFQLYIKALLSVFKGRSNDFKDKETAVERCEVELHDSPEETKCRLIVHMICRQGVVKIYRLTYEAVEVQHAVFDKSKTQNLWSINSRLLREIIDHFGPTSEQLDVYADNGRAIFTSFTEKVMSGKEILKQPVNTAVAIDTKEFENFTVDERLHVIINVKDFKAIVIHSDCMKANLVARYTRPCRPLQLSYDCGGMACEFTLMTRGEAGDGAASSSNGNARELSARASSRPPAQAASSVANQPAPEGRVPARMRSPQPLVSSLREASVSLPPRPTASIDPNSLFVPADDDQQWDEPNYADEEEDILGWDVNMDHQDAQRVGLSGQLRDTVPESASLNSRDGSGQEGSTALPPTQRISQIRGLFD
ncbi:hypothetical protein AJ80_01244 [Polytolypa hystricis UAMH7299]|uniref:DNA repair protein rad9 n=1 Tax=Polytolypa hystricis (strain UAMH7299) TaxID=1447883 RepID=A0A2B7Z1Q5_POLH7|nr:hypothetical protein AJ80_01244 [Polytolypa hystricis UAMH7299]